MITGILIKCRERLQVHRAKNLNVGRRGKGVPIFWRKPDDSIWIT
jgi:hypothetical protein